MPASCDFSRLSSRFIHNIKEEKHLTVLAWLTYNYRVLRNYLNQKRQFCRDFGTTQFGYLCNEQ
jgi:hypothetical protein